MKKGDRFLSGISTQLRSEGIRVALSVRKGWINARFVVPSTGKQVNRSIGYRETTSLTELAEVEALIRRLWTTAQDGGDYDVLFPAVQKRRTQVQKPPSPVKTKALGVRDSVCIFEDEHWQRVRRTSSTENSYNMTRAAFSHLEPSAALSLSLLKSTVLMKSIPDSRSRKNLVETYIRLGKRFNVENIESLKEIKGHYRPQARDLPTDEAIETFLDYLYEIKHIYRWHYAALATYGTRPGEVPSIVPNQPTESGDPRNYIGRALTIKRKYSLPTVRSIFAFPTRWYERYKLWEVIESDAEYKSEVRLYEAHSMLLEGYSRAAVVSQLAESNGVCRRTAQRTVRDAHALLQKNIDQSKVHGNTNRFASRKFRWTEPAEFDAEICATYRDSLRRSVTAKTLSLLVNKLFPHFDCLQFRHRYAVRTIEANCNFDLTARAMGHSAQVHLNTYRAYVQQDELANMMARQLGASAETSAH